MAVSFQLECSDLTNVDLDNTTCFRFQNDDYVPAVATPTGDGSIPPYVTETIPIMLRGASYDAIAACVQDLAALQKRAAEYWVNQQQAVPVWLGCKLDGETQKRQALVKSIDFAFRPSIEPLLSECPGAAPPEYILGTILVKRHPYWERDVARVFPNATPAAEAAVAYDYTATADIVGDVPARIAALTLYTTATDALWRFWMGIRSATLHGATGVTGFIPIWECEDGVRNVDTSIYLAAPGGGSGAGDDTVVVDPGFGGSGWDWDAAYINVETLSAANVGYATYSDCFGRFLWLFRAKVTAGTWSVYLRSGLYAAENYFDPITVSNTNWDYHELAVCTIPTFDAQAIESTTIVHIPILWLYAKRLTGAGDLHLDCLCPVPTDEGFLKIMDGRIVSGSVYTILGEGPHGHQQVLGIENQATDYDRNTAAFEWEHFGLPPGDGRIICVYADNALSVITDDIEFADPALSASRYYERWTSLRGAE